MLPKNTLAAEFAQRPAREMLLHNAIETVSYPVTITSRKCTTFLYNDTYIEKDFSDQPGGGAAQALGD